MSKESTEPTIEELQKQLDKSQKELAKAKSDLEEAKEIIKGQEKALSEAVPASEAASVIVSHKGKRYAFTAPSFNLDGTIVSASEATKEQIAVLVERKTSLLREV